MGVRCKWVWLRLIFLDHGVIFGVTEKVKNRPDLNLKKCETEKEPQAKIKSSLDKSEKIKLGDI